MLERHALVLHFCAAVLPYVEFVRAFSAKPTKCGVITLPTLNADITIAGHDVDDFIDIRFEPDERKPPP